MKKWKQLMALLLAAAMILALAACGNSNVEETKAPEFVYQASFRDLKDRPEEVSYFYPSMSDKDGFYAFVSVVVGQRELEEGEELYYDGQLNVYEDCLYRLDMNGNWTRLDGYHQLDMEFEEGHSGYVSTYSILKCADGFLAMDEVYENWSNSGDDVELYSDEWYAGWQYQERYFLRRLDENGTELSRVEMQIEELLAENEYMYFSGIADGGDGKVIVSGDSGLYVFSLETGELLSKIGGLNWVERLLTLRDGRVVAIYYGDDGMQVATVDVAKGKLGPGTGIMGDTYQAFTGGGDYDFYYNNGVNFFGYKIDTGEANKIFNWINCDVDNQNLSGFLATEDGKILALQTEWDANYENPTFSLVTMEKVSSDTLPKKEVLTLATQYLDWNARSAIIKFNRSHDSVRIELQDYSEYNTQDDYEAGLTKLRTEMLAGNCPDIIDLSGMPAKQLAAKGVLADLYPLIDADPELSREDFFPNVLAIMENNGKLYSTISSFEIISAVGASSVVGTEPGWTYTDLMNALAQMPEGCTVFSQGETRYDVLQMCLMLDMDRFVDWNTGEVSFDSQEFIDLLNFTKNFPADFDWENYEWSEEDSDYARMRQGKQLLLYGDLYGFSSITDYENLFGGLDAFTFIGFPTSEGVGSMLSASSGYGITEKCQNKEAAWEFVRMFMTEEYQSSNIWSFPSNIHSYEKMREDAMTPSYVKDADGHILVDPETGERQRESKGGYWDEANQEWVEIYSYSREEIDKVESVIKNTTRVYLVDESINEIVREQVEAFFAGQRSAEDVAKLIQSKTMIYVNEQR